MARTNPPPLLTMRDLVMGRQQAGQLRGRFYGIEVEAERFPADEMLRLREGVGFEADELNNLRGVWRVTLDGSLRHNGVEFVSHPMRADQVGPALYGLYSVFRAGLVRTSVRAGIHIHVNSGDLTPEDYVTQLQNYVLLEPLLFQVAGDVRAQNIYCVPWYLTNDEMGRVRRVCRTALARQHVNLRAALGETCKYSALFLGPMLNFGTVEYRHAPTFSRERDMQRWHKLVALAVDTRLDLSDLSSVHTLPERFDGFGIDWERYYRDVETRDLYARARSLQPCTYKAKPWGRPASMSFPAITKPAPTIQLEEAPRPAPGSAAEALEQYRASRRAAQAPEQPRLRVRRTPAPTFLIQDEATQLNAATWDTIETTETQEDMERVMRDMMNMLNAQPVRGTDQEV